jgi:lipopolysaccharide export system protein LptA
MYRPILLLALIFAGTLLHAQEENKIEILNSDYMEYDASIASGVVKYVGEVAFKQQNMLLSCDSAWYFAQENNVHAFGNVHIIQGDTLNLYGDELRYYGNNKFAEMRQHVTLIDKETTLTSDYLDFDLENNVGYYERHGHIVNGDNTLDSRAGYYYSGSKMLNFRDSVVIVNPEYTIFADTLEYNTVTEIAYFLGPTEIISPDNYIYCENGWYDTQNNVSQFNKNAYLESDEQYLRGDSLFYDRNNGMGMAFDNVELYDSAQQIILLGKYAIYFEEPEYAMLTDSAILIQISDEDSLFVHADTLKSVVDSTGQYKILRAYYKVKFHRPDMQGKCDSLAYLESDSVFQLFGDPVLWSEIHQLTAEQMNVYMAFQEPDYIEMSNAAFIISQDDSIRFNQIRGRDMVGHFSEDQLSHIDVKGNGQSLWFGRDEGDLIGVNKAESSDIKIYLANGGVERVNMISTPSATLYPPDELLKEDLYLSGFIWLEEHRPKTKQDIFRWTDH